MEKESGVRSQKTEDRRQ